MRTTQKIRQNERTQRASALKQNCLNEMTTQITKLTVEIDRLNKNIDVVTWLASTEPRYRLEKGRLESDRRAFVAARLELIWERSSVSVSKSVA